MVGVLCDLGGCSWLQILLHLLAILPLLKSCLN